MQIINSNMEWPYIFSFYYCFNFFDHIFFPFYTKLKSCFKDVKNIFWSDRKYTLKAIENMTLPRYWKCVQAFKNTIHTSYRKHNLHSYRKYDLHSYRIYDLHSYQRVEGMACIAIEGMASKLSNLIFVTISFVTFKIVTV